MKMTLHPTQWTEVSGKGESTVRSTSLEEKTGSNTNVRELETPFLS